jgi:Uma2 family endonuclease
MVQATKPPAPKTSLTLADFLSLPETKPASEFIDGEIHQKPMPKGKHSAIQSELTPALNHNLKPSKIARAFTELRCTFGNRSIVSDIAIFTWDRIACDPSGDIANTFAIAPDWTIEILSPDQSQTKVVKNILHCLKHGATLGWLIDPDDRTVFIYHPNGTLQLFDDPAAQLPVPAFAQSITLTVDDLFSWLSK